MKYNDYGESAFPGHGNALFNSTYEINAYEFFGGVTRIHVPDNLKTGVTKRTKSEIVLNRSYQEMVEHYGTAIIPTRIRVPKDKATVEGTVGIISTYILAAIVNEVLIRIAIGAVHQRL